MFNYLFLFFIINAMLFSFTYTQLLTEDECITPRAVKGTCINLKTCGPLLTLLTATPRLPSSIQLVRESHCGYEGLDPKVCCPPTTSSGGPELPVTGTPVTPRPVTNRPVTPRPVTPVTNRPAPPTTGGTQPNVDSSYPYYRERPPSIEGHPNLRLLPADCGNTEDNKAIGGNKTGVFEFPWMSLLAYNLARGTRFMCGGTIINSRYILTAAHCITNLERRTLAGVRVGEHDISTPEDCEPSIPEPVCAPPYQDISIEEVIVHPNYVGGKGKNALFQHDVGLLRLSTPIEMADNIFPICLPTTRELQELRTDGLYMTMAGWGATETEVSSPSLLKISIPVVENIQCGRVLNGSVRDGVGFRQMCAGGLLNVDSCGGDSGGPLKYLGRVNGVLRYVEHGIVSFGSRNCGREGVPGVYTRVAYYMDWILDNLKP